jgi:hypothetical protein
MIEPGAPAPDLAGRNPLIGRPLFIRHDRRLLT